MFPSFSRPILNQGGKYVVNSGWGADRSYRGGTHNGFDAAAPVGLPVRAVASGKVVGVGDWGANGGKAIVIEHLPGLKTRYLHLDRFAVGSGDSIYSGQLIGYSGSTGTSSPHLHFDIRGTQPWVDEYVRRFGTPTPWPGEYTSGGYGIPAEPLVPVDVYTANVVSGAKTRGIPLYTGIGLGLGVLVVGGIAAYFLLKGRKS